MFKEWLDLWTRASGGGAGEMPGVLKAIPGADPEHLARLQREYFEAQSTLWVRALAGGFDASSPAGAPAEPREGQGKVPADRRFASSTWHDQPYYGYLVESYRLAERFYGELAASVPLRGQERERLLFAARQWTDALSPANFVLTNPEVLRRAMQSNGESLARGIANLIADATKGRITQTDESAFELGRNLAATPGSVVFENALMQLIQYRPTGAQVARRPLVMVPPCINKFYILDLQQENSFVRHALEAGNDVFMVSWRNPGASEAHLTWDDYVESGVLQALAIAREISGADSVNALGFCVGGTLLGAALGVLAARAEPLPASATYLAAMHDFSDTGQLGLFIDDASVQMREAALGAGGLLAAAELSSVFSMLRANDLIWPYVVNNYLLGEQPAAFDLLHWNSDGTNLPGPMYCYYLRNMYLENKLRIRGALSACGVALDLSAVDVPSFYFAAQEDHIVPWRTAYRSLRVFGGDKTFVLGASGHVAGVINPPAKGRRSFWIGSPARKPAGAFPERAEDWLRQAGEQPGSWWPTWTSWLAKYSGGLRKAPAQPGNRRFKVIEPAPGRYVKEQAPASSPAAMTSSPVAERKAIKPGVVKPGAVKVRAVERNPVKPDAVKRNAVKRKTAKRKTAIRKTVLGKRAGS